MSGLFITFEGGEGVGKTLQTRLLGDFLTSCKKEVMMTREPGGTEISEKIRHILLTGDPEKTVPLTESLLYLAARSEHWNRKIKPALDAGKVVICDRFQDSSIVYQGFCKNVSISLMNLIFKEITSGKIPDRTYLIDLDPSIGISRSLSKKNNKETRFEKMDISYHKMVQEEFIRLAKTEPKRFLIIDGGLSILEIQEIIKNDIKKLFGQLTKY
ncbi:MAG: dTMP kinase [Holosporales bacterium]|nr:dTMP kinase [Holosporales bacterium]